MSKYSGSGCRIRGVSSRCLDRSLNPAAALGRLAGRHPKTTTPQRTHPSRKLLFILNHLTDPQGEPKSQIQVPEVTSLFSSVMVDPT
jgi:hypothetical protein